MCRASIRGGTVTLNRWSPVLYRAGPAPLAMARLQASLADLHRLDEDELLVVPVPGSPWGLAVDATLAAWATRVGYRRLWLPGHVATLDELPELSTVAVDCPTCGARWEDEAVGFWEMVREDGWFPGFCRACGGSLPEWTEESAVDEGQKVVQFERYVG
ncbi:MAG: hypothetical protein H0V81_15360 [Solirubrobacterales bacterium]|nr:hypothetical protein [Solirubrobacterales bacterium]